MIKKPYLIAEIGINHNGDLKIAKKLIKNAKDTGFDAVKFQKRDIYKVYSKEILNTPTEPGEDELVFEDDPRAVNEIEYGKVVKKSVGYVHSESSLGNVIVDTKIK